MSRNLQAIVFDFDGVIANSEPLHLHGVPAGARRGRHRAHGGGLLRALSGLRRRRRVPGDWPRPRPADERRPRGRAGRPQGRHLQRCWPPDGCSSPARSSSSGRRPTPCRSRSRRARCATKSRRSWTRRASPRSSRPSWPRATRPRASRRRRHISSLSSSCAQKRANLWIRDVCVAIEDSRWGLESARGAGLRCVGVTNSYPARALEGAAELIVEGLGALTLAGARSAGGAVATDGDERTRPTRSSPRPTGRARTWLRPRCSSRASSIRDLDPEPYLARLDAMGDAARQAIEQHVGRHRPTARTIACIGRVNAVPVRRIWGSSATASSYEDPRNSCLNEVLDRRTGIPITLSRRLHGGGAARRAARRRRELPRPLPRALPGRPSRGTQRAHHRPVPSRRAAVGARLPHAAAAARRIRGGVQPVAARAGHALADHRPHAAEPEAASTCTCGRSRRRATSPSCCWRSTPSALSELRDRGLLAYHLNDVTGALRDLQTYLKLASMSEMDKDAREEHEQIWEHVKTLRRRVASLN